MRNKKTTVKQKTAVKTKTAVKKPTGAASILHFTTPSM
jgi:hypothetical protein